MQIILLSFSLVLVYSGSVPRCPENEHFTRCASPCQANCQNNVTLPCSEVCIMGCVCREGYIREGKGGQCVLVINASTRVPICGKNEKFASCGSACPRNCGDEEVKPCSLICVKGCVCEQGYVREKDGGRCVAEEDCSKSIK
ncbi:hypothetical protein Zmor_011463 [Zophobas morio]|uniref:TIL domain-containing protein n=1 Tax=Zophobas morio TaxID=2755281 RepID=A0AA38ILY6_9CUCU|nr:hypothetical protein Zmor_011463 [Zophobas morio]